MLGESISEFEQANHCLVEAIQAEEKFIQVGEPLGPNLVNAIKHLAAAHKLSTSAVSSEEILAFLDSPSNEGSVFHLVNRLLIAHRERLAASPRV